MNADAAQATFQSEIQSEIQSELQPGQAPVFSPAEMREHLDRLRSAHPTLAACVDVERAEAWAREFAATAHADDFGAIADGGRGEPYLRAQAGNGTARARGIERLLGYIRAADGPAAKIVVDVLGGDGLVRRVAAALGLDDVEVLSGDLSPFMVRAAWAGGSPALVQRADRLLQRDASVDGVLVAYGTHHIDSAQRPLLAGEAHRVLREQGVLVLHDFLVGSPMAVWFEQVVDRYSRTRHPYPHFTRAEIHDCLGSAGFRSCELHEIADPYVASGRTADEAERAVGRYLLDMYGLDALEHVSDPERWAVDRAATIFGRTVELDPVTGRWCCTVPRTAIVGVGRK